MQQFPITLGGRRNRENFTKWQPVPSGGLSWRLLTSELLTPCPPTCFFMKFSQQSPQSPEGNGLIKITLLAAKLDMLVSAPRMSWKSIWSWVSLSQKGLFLVKKKKKKKVANTADGEGGISVLNFLLVQGSLLLLSLCAPVSCYVLWDFHLPSAHESCKNHKRGNSSSSMTVCVMQWKKVRTSGTARLCLFSDFYLLIIGQGILPFETMVLLHMKQG